MPETARKRLLLVDDYQDALEMWSAFLRSSGYEVSTATNGRDALALATNEQPDLVILDLQLPEISGIEVARRLRALETTAHIPLVAVTGFSQESDHDVAREAGIDVVIVKPCDPPALLAEVARILETRQPTA